MQVKNVTFNPLLIRYKKQVYHIPAGRIGQVPDEFLKSVYGKPYLKALMPVESTKQLQKADEASQQQPLTNNKNPMEAATDPIKTPALKELGVIGSVDASPTVKDKK